MATNPLIAIGIVTALPALGAAAALNARLKRARPTARSFLWGFYISVQVGLLYLMITFALLYTLLSDGASLAVGIAMLCAAAISFAAVLGIRRHPLGFIIVTLATLNPVTWLINYLYGSRRWEELRLAGTTPDAPIDRVPAGMADRGASIGPNSSSQPSLAPSPLHVSQPRSRIARLTRSQMVVLSLLHAVVLASIHFWQDITADRADHLRSTAPLDACSTSQAAEFDACLNRATMLVLGNINAANRLNDHVRVAQASMVALVAWYFLLLWLWVTPTPPERLSAPQ